MPATQTQNKQILEHLHTHGSITPIMALQRYGCMRLGARIWDLKQAGHRITKVMERRAGKQYARYELDA